MPDLLIHAQSYKRSKSGTAPDLGDPPIARLGTQAGMPKAIFNEDDDISLRHLARIGQPTAAIPRRAPPASRR